MSFTFRPATREGIHLIAGLAGGTGSGKTYSALRLATGLAAGKPFAVIDTEAGRAKHHAGEFRFDHGDLKAPFSPGAYLEAILAAEAAGYPVIVADSMSHEHEGEGGLLEWHDAEHQRMGGKESQSIAAWIKPKTAHRQMVSRLLQLRAHLILCFRAAPKIKIVKEGDPLYQPSVGGRTQVIDMGWVMIAAKGLEFELTTSFLLSHERPGVPDHPLKPLPPALRAAFAKDRPIDEKTGEMIAAWASGAAPVVPGAATTALITSFASMDKAALAALFTRESAGWRALAEVDQAAIRAALGDRARALGLAGLKGLAELAAGAGSGATASAGTGPAAGSGGQS